MAILEYWLLEQWLIEVLTDSMNIYDHYICYMRLVIS